MSKFICDGIEKGKNLSAVYFICILIVGANISSIIGIFEFQPYANLWRISVSITLFALVLRSFFNYKKTFVYRILLLAIMVAIIYTNLVYLKDINIDFWWQNIS